ncbi:MAG TPA: ABC transporter permease [Puia sp.]|nr:ABC transporter permease [Puia sp.]
MLQNFWKIALRQLRKQGFYSAIKIGGFALGIATCLLIALYIRNELHYDRDWVNGDRLYRVIQSFKRDDGTIGKGPAEPAAFAQAMKKEFPEVEAAGRIMPYPLFGGAGSNEVRPENKTQDTYEEGFTYADQAILDMFRIPMVYGDRAHALTEPNSVVISKRKADKYFPGQDPVGKAIYLNDDKTPHKIGGVMQDMPLHTHLQYDFLLSLAGHELWPHEQETWMAQNYDVYVMLKPGSDPVQLQGKLVLLLKTYQLPQLAGAGIKNAAALMDRCSFLLQPVSDIHLRNGDIHDSQSHGDIRFVRLFGAVGIFILLLAVINFINLSTARSAGRAKEVGLRKVVGSQRGALVRQFLVESLVLSWGSFVLAIGLAWVLLPVFDALTDTRLAIPWTSWWLAPVMILSATAVGLAAGIYPAFVLSQFKPAEVLKGQFSRGARASGLRSVLVVIQFSTSVVLIVATFVVYRQVRYIMDKKMGFDKDQVMLIQGTGTIDPQYPNSRLKAFKGRLLSLPGVKSASISDFLPVSGGKRNMNTFWKSGREKLDPGTAAQSWWVDPDYLKTMGMQLVRGRMFSYDIASDSSAVVINQTMASKLGFADPLGHQIDWGGDFKMHIVGVVADFNYESVKDAIDPLVLHRGDWATVVAVKADTKDVAGLIRGVGTVWKEYAPQQDFRYVFLDESFARMYADVQRTGNIFTALAALALVIACLGLFALAAFMAEQRRKEIGIRKVLGATVQQLMGMLSKDFLRLILVSIFIATPIAYWGMHRWLEDYRTRIEIGWWVFAAAGAMVAGIAMVTIAVQAVRAAVASPVGSLRSE